MQKLRTTINPDAEIEVDDREAADLDRMGLVLKGTSATTEQGLNAAATRQVQNNAAGAAGSDDSEKGND